jgi:hypothetical protein
MNIPVAEPQKKRSAFVARIIAILSKPDTEWPVIDREPATIRSLYTSWILILAAVPPVCHFIGSVVFGYSFLGITYRPSFLSALSTAVASYALSLAGVFIVALIIEALAPTFQGQKDRVQALKLVAYAATASWLSGVFGLLPGLGFLSLLGLYSVYLFYKGLPVLMKSPKDKTLSYTAVVAIAALVVSLLITPITAVLVGAPAALLGSSGTVKLPGGSEVGLDRLQQAARNMEDVARRAQSGANPAGVSTDTLQQFLPASLPGGLARHDLSSTEGQIAGFGGSSVKAEYGSNGKTLTLSVTDLGAAGAIAALGGALGIKGAQQTGSSVSRMDQVNGRTIVESYDAQTRGGNSSVVVANRFLVNAEGSSVTLDALRGAVNAVDLSKLEAMAR